MTDADARERERVGMVRTRAELAPADATPPVFALFERALEKGGDAVAGLETIYKLYAAEREHTARIGFARALAAFQESCPPVPRSSKAKIVTRGGGQFEYAFADFEQIVETIGPHLRANGLSYAFDSSVDGAALTCVCVLRHVDGHSERSTFTLPTATASAMSAQQAVGAALTFAKRQTLTAALGLALTDPDPDNTGDPSTITEEQAANLRALIDETRSDLAKVLAYAAAASLEEIRASEYARVLAALEAKRKGAK